MTTSVSVMVCWSGRYSVVNWEIPMDFLMEKLTVQLKVFEMEHEME